MKQAVNIIGAGGFGREVASMLPRCGRQLASLYDDNSSIAGVKASTHNLLKDENPFVIAIGNSRQREKVYLRLPGDLMFDILIHPSAILQERESITIGEGSIITAGSILTCDINLGRFTIINLNCTMGHGVQMGDFCSLMPAVNLGGEVKLGQGVYIGTGATILPGIHIGDNAIVGAGAVVTRNVPANTTVKGIPARSQ